MGSWLRNDILVLFIELFRVHINQRSASRHFSFELIKAPYSFAFNLLSLKQTNFLLPPPCSSFSLSACMHKVGGLHTEQNVSVSVSRGVEPEAPRPHGLLSVSAHDWGLRRGKLTPGDMRLWGGHGVSAWGEFRTLHRTVSSSKVDFSVLKMWAKRHFLQEF